VLLPEFGRTEGTGARAITTRDEVVAAAARDRVHYHADMVVAEEAAKRVTRTQL
jgi:hypothetical protein